MTPAQMMALLWQLADLRLEVERLRAERDKYAAEVVSMMEDHQAASP